MNGCLRSLGRSPDPLDRMNLESAHDMMCRWPWIRHRLTQFELYSFVVLVLYGHFFDRAYGYLGLVLYERDGHVSLRGCSELVY